MNTSRWVFSQELLGNGPIGSTPIICHGCVVMVCWIFPTVFLLASLTCLHIVSDLKTHIWPVRQCLEAFVCFITKCPVDGWSWHALRSWGCRDAGTKTWYNVRWGSWIMQYTLSLIESLVVAFIYFFYLNCKCSVFLRPAVGLSIFRHPSLEDAACLVCSDQA